MSETSMFPVRWSSTFLLTDADQPVANLKTLLTGLRTNQWVLLSQNRFASHKSFYPFRKREIQPRITDADPRSTVSDALDLPQLGSETLNERSRDLQLAAPEHGVEYLNRKVLLDQNGTPLAIAEAKTPVETRSYAARAESVGPPERESYAAVVEADGSSPDREPEDGEYRVVRIYYGTDRKEVTQKGGRPGYSGERCDDEQLKFGTCDVSIPRDRRMGTLESPRWWHVFTKRKPAKSVVLLSTLPTSKGDFFAQLQAATAKPDSKALFVFIHGFNVQFEDGARRTAQLAYDLGFQGPPILYSWPSAGRLKAYMADEATIEWTKPHLKQFIQDLVLHAGASGVHIIAHSMGNRALVRVLNELGTLACNQHLVKQVILTAPDIDTGEFYQLAAAMTSTAQRVTLYASSKDLAIEISKTFHKYPRAGEAEANIVIQQGIDTIDSSTVDTSLLGHSYYCDERTVLSDVFYVITGGIPPSMRHGLERRQCHLGQYWAFKA